MQLRSCSQHVTRETAIGGIRHLAANKADGRVKPNVIRSGAMFKKRLLTSNLPRKQHFLRPSALATIYSTTVIESVPPKTAFYEPMTHQSTPRITRPPDSGPLPNTIPSYRVHNPCLLKPLTTPPEIQSPSNSPYARTLPITRQVLTSSASYREMHNTPPPLILYTRF